jgi:hypothetical protein
MAVIVNGRLCKGFSLVGVILLLYSSRGDREAMIIALLNGRLEMLLFDTGQTVKKPQYMIP